MSQKSAMRSCNLDQYIQTFALKNKNDSNITHEVDQNEARIHANGKTGAILV